MSVDNEVESLERIILTLDDAIIKLHELKYMALRQRESLILQKEMIDRKKWRE